MDMDWAFWALLAFGLLLVTGGLVGLCVLVISLTEMLHNGYSAKEVENEKTDNKTDS